MARTTRTTRNITPGNGLTGKNLTQMPVRNSVPVVNASPVTQAIIRNITVRKSFTDGVSFVSAVTTTVHSKFPSMTRMAVMATAYRALAKYFA